MKITRKDQRRKETRSNMRGGKGDILFEHLFEGSDIKANCRLCAQVIIPVGGSIGLHQHIGEDEVFIIQKGQGIISDGESESHVGPGDSILTLGDGSHSLENTGDVPLEFTAVVMTYPT